MLPHRARFLALPLFLASFACRTPNHAEAKAATPAASSASHGLDVNDVSLLFPLPDAYADTPKMIGLSTLLASGAPLVSQALFEDALRHFKYTADLGGTAVKLNAGVDFSAANTASQTANAFGLYERWKIVAMRYDPCAPSAAHNLRSQPETGAASPGASGECSPQLRLTAQPLVPFSDARDFPQPDAWQYVDRPFVGDYAIHLIFALSPDASRSVYADLTAFRDTCGDVTSGVPLMSQPCLVSSSWGASDRFPDGSGASTTSLSRIAPA